MTALAINRNDTTNNVKDNAPKKDIITAWTRSEVQGSLSYKFVIFACALGAMLAVYVFMLI